VTNPGDRIDPEFGGRHRIVIACPNLSLDRTVSINRLSVGSVHRSRKGAVRGGGKGVNVARALGHMGFTDVAVVGFVAGHTGAAVAGMLRDEDIELVPVETRGETRSCLTVLAPVDVTLFNESGPTIDERDWDRLEKSLRPLVENAEIVICSGSFPPGTPLRAAARVVEYGRAAGATTLCDTSKEYLSFALGAEPDLVAPNLAEAEVALDLDPAGDLDSDLPGPQPRRTDASSGPQRAESPPVVGSASGRDSDLDEALELASQLQNRGPGAAIVTAGSSGTALATPATQRLWQAAPVDAVNPVGAGDCLVAGVALGLTSGRDLVQSTRLGMAMAGAGCERFIAGDLDPARALDLIDHYD
jgi:fructose-1-phosphate kinase PfkB-like protein